MPRKILIILFLIFTLIEAILSMRELQALSNLGGAVRVNNNNRRLPPARVAGAPSKGDKLSFHKSSSFTGVAAIGGHNGGVHPLHSSSRIIMPIMKGSSRDNAVVVEDHNHGNRGEEKEKREEMEEKKKRAEEYGEILTQRLAEILPKGEVEKVSHSTENGEVRKSAVELDKENVALVAKLLANYQYRHKVKEAEFSSGRVSSAEKRFYADNLEEAVVLLKAMHDSDRVHKYEMPITHIQQIIKLKEGNVEKITENAPLFYLKTNLWGVLNIHTAEDAVNEKAAEVMAPILAAKQFVARISKDFEIKNSEDDLGERAAGILKNMENAIKVVDGTTKILLDCGNFRDKNVWKEEPLNLVVPPALLRSKPLTKEQMKNKEMDG